MTCYANATEQLLRPLVGHAFTQLRVELAGGDDYPPPFPVFKSPPSNYLVTHISVELQFQLPVSMPVSMPVSIA